MSLSRLAAKCRACPHVDDCDHKEMEAYGFLPLPKPTELLDQRTVTGYRIVLAPRVDDLVSISGEICMDADKLVRMIAQELNGH